MSRSSTFRDEDDFNQGFILPPIVAQLRKLLEQFPDDIQIIRELVQNAEDAGAREVNFMLDLNTYGLDPRLLEHPDLAQFQGPALYAHNDAIFKEDDWKGLRMLSQSLKRDDPFNIGCFGVGFKSVFHLTDLPCTLSGDRLAIIDPHQRLFENTCHSLPLTPALLSTLTHQVAPYLETFGCNRSTFQTGYYPGTIFRFPLRNKPSGLSSCTCSVEKVRELMESLEKEAHLMLIFTSNISRVSIYERSRGTRMPVLVFRAELAPSCVEEVQRMRTDFKNNVKDHGAVRQVSSTFEVVILTEKLDGRSPVKSSYRYLVSHLNGVTTVKSSQIFINLLNDRDLNFLPCVATAMPLDTQDCEPVANDDDPSNVMKRPFHYLEDDGRVFSFLPLPLDKNGPSGLPFLVHGAFSLEQNKKQMKWPAVSRFTDFSTDPLVQWNQCLLKEVLPPCFTQMISTAISINVQDKYRIPIRSIYRAYPDFSRIERRWEPIVPLLCVELFRSTVFHCPNAHSWSDIKGCLFINGATAGATGGDLPINMEKAIYGVMTCGKLRVASCPHHVMLALKKMTKPAVVTPMQVADVLRSVQNNTSISWSDKMNLLRYFLNYSKVELLNGLELLPLANGGFTSFKISSTRSTPQQPVYVAPDEETRLALPGLYDDTLEWDIDEDIKKSLMATAIRGSTQLKPIDFNVACKLLPRCLPSDWLSSDDLKPQYPIVWNPENKDHPPEGWLKCLWEFLTRNCPRDLSCVDGIPIIPHHSYDTTISNYDEVVTTIITELIPLSPNQVILCRMWDDLQLDSNLESALTQLGIWVIDEPPDWIKNHPHLYKGGPLLTPINLNILRALEKRCAVDGGRVKFVEEVFSALSTKHKRAIRNSLAQISSFEIQKDTIELISTLPIFESLGVAKHPDEAVLIAASKARAWVTSVEQTALPILSSIPVINCSTKDCQNLSKLLGIKPLTVSQLLMQVVFPDIVKGRVINRDDIIEVALHCLENYQHLKEADKSLRKFLKSLAFLPRGDVLLNASRFYDPTDEVLQALFVFEENFPPQTFCHPDVLAALRDLGLRMRDEVGALDLKECALVVQQLSIVPDLIEILPSLSSKSNALLDYLQRKSLKLSEKYNALTLSQILRDIRFVRSLDRPSVSEYPSSLKWFGGYNEACSDIQQVFYCPSQMTLKQHALVVGSTMPLVACDVSSSDIVRAMGWGDSPPIAHVVRHLANVIKSYSTSEQALYVDVVVAIYQVLSNHPNEDELLQLIAIHLPLEWVWYGNGFAKPQDLVLNSPSIRMNPRDFHPYIYCLPDELTDYKQFFAKFGAAQSPDPIRMLEMIRAKYELGTSRGAGFRSGEVQSDLHLCISLLEDYVFPDGRPDSDSKTESAEDEDFVRSLPSSSVDARGDEINGRPVWSECTSPLFFSSAAFFSPQSQLAASKDVHLPAYEPDNSASSNRIRFEKADLCVYCDAADLGIGRGYWLDKHKELQQQGLHLVHPLIPIDVCKALGIPSLAGINMSNVAEDIGFSPPESTKTAGSNFRFQQQSSTPFTEVIRPLVEPFTSNDFCLPIEMIQNADDAGATEIRFLLDERLNLDARGCLLDEGMGYWQGPALWVYNDMIMTDDDFAEAFTLDGTKKNVRTDRVGRNGRGLCSVYTVTDVPSFVSRNWVVFFDPHFRYLGRSLKEKSKFGLRINLNRYRRQLNSLGGQFKPYEGIFGWSLKNADIHYPATLFRLPLRNRHLASKSDICSKACEVEDVKDMFRLMHKIADNLLLFSQNLVKISVHHLGEKGSLSSELVELFTITKRPVKIIRELRPEVPRDPSGQTFRFLDVESQKMVRHSGLLRSSTEVLKQIKKSSSHVNLERFSPGLPDSSAIILTEVKFSQNAERLLRLRKDQNRRSPWLVTSCMEKGEALSTALKHDDLISCAGAAVPLEELPEHDCYRPIPLFESQESVGGMVFNFFPTSISTGLPVHINGSFLVSDDHQTLSRESKKSAAHSTWNDKLMSTAVAQAYLRLVCDMAAISPPDSYPFHLLWPDLTQVSPECLALVKTFFKELSRMSKTICTIPPMVFSDGNKWCSFESTYFFDCCYTDQKLSEASMQVSRQVMAGSQSGVILVRLPVRILRGFDQAGASKAVSSRTYNKVQFFEKVFFPHIESIPAGARDLLILEALPQARHDSNLAVVLKNWQCVPVGNGTRFEKPSKLVDPRSPLYVLYGKNESLAPYQKYSSDFEILDALCSLGMKYQAKDVSWEDVVNKCRSLQSCKDPTLVRETVQAALLVIDEKIATESDKSFSSLRHFQQVLADLPFLLAKPRPSDFLLPLWAGMSDMALKTSQQKIQLHRASVLFSPECLGLVCCIKPIMDESILPRDPSNVFSFLKIGINWKEPTISQVADQLDVLTNPEHEQKLKDRKFREEIEQLCLSCYAFLQMKCTGPKSQQRAVYDALKGRYFVLCEQRFLLPNQLAFNFPHNGSPYLFQLPDSYKREFPDLFRITEVKDQFSVKDFVEALQSLHDARPRVKLDRDSYSLAATLLGLLKESMKQAGLRTSEVIERYGPIYLPDSSNFLRSTSEMNIDEVTSQSTPPVSRSSSVKMSRDVQPPLSTQHNPVQRHQPEHSQRYSSTGYSQSSSRLNEPAVRTSRAFGTRGPETLITRLRRVICGGRSNDRDILKELLRVADDAGATEVCFVKDPRTHRTHEDFWQQQQGPSLCVHFNKSLTNTHLENILAYGHTRRGRGISKLGDPGKTGLYGVGFDSSYRLTDIPSILTGDGSSESICIFDPQARFIGGTTFEEPARQFDALNAIRQSNPGVLNSYLEDKFSIQDGTTIRLPLRTPVMAAQSELSEEQVVFKTLDVLFDKFRQEIFDCILFLESVSSVSIFEIEPNTDVLRELYKISVDNKEFNVDGKSEFYENVERAQSQTQKLIDLPNYEVTYPLTISDNHGHWEKWVISHRFGLDASAKVPVSVNEAIQAGRLVLSPYGSVAAMLDSSDAESHNRPSKVFTRLPLNAKIELPVHLNSNFCIDDEAGRNLWPEEESGFKTDWNNLLLRSVVAHAYVAVLSQTPPMMGCVKSGAGACVYLGTLDSSGDEIPELEIYARFFPKLNRQMPYCYWRNLMESVYQIIDTKQVAVIPVAKACAGDHPSSVSSSMSTSVTTGTTEVEWYPTRVAGYQKPYFDNLKESYKEIEEQLRASQSASSTSAPSFTSSSSSQARKRRSRSHFKKQPYEVLRWSLLACGFKLSRLPFSVCESFLAAGIGVACVTPKAVVDFFKSFQKLLSIPVVSLPQLPCELSQTPFRDEATLKILLDYCSQDIPYFRSNLSGLPLLLCEDGLLKSFSSARDKRVFLSNAHLLLPGSEALFVHHSLVGSVFKEADVESCDVFWRFDVRSFANDLPSVLDRAYAMEATIRRDITDIGCPKDVWLRDVWSFLADEFQRTSESSVSSQQQDDRSLAINLLQPLMTWCLLPVVLRVRTPENSPTTPNKTITDSQVNNYSEDETTPYLVPFSLAHAVLDYSGNNISGNQIRRCFGRMGIFELDVNFFEENPGSQVFSPMASNKNSTKVFISGSSSTQKILSFLRLVVSNPENPRAVLTSVEYVLSRPEGPENVGLNLDESFTILKYFNDAAHSWKYDKAIRNRLLLMPVHSSADERLVPIDVEQAYILESSIPSIGMEQWQKKTKTIFIKPCLAFETLYNILGLKTITSSEAYVNHLFRSFDCLPYESREEHLLHLRNSIVPYLTNSEKTDFLMSLSKTKLLPDSRDVRLLRRPTDLYDPRISIYEAMARTNSSVTFPAPPYDDPEWLDFFVKHARLESEPTGDSLVTFAKQIASDSKRLGTSNDVPCEVLEVQCQSLMKHLFNPKITAEPQVLEKLIDVAFIPPARPQTIQMKLIHPSQGRESLRTNQNTWVTFKDCASYRHHDVCWSSWHLLPSWADPHELLRGTETKDIDLDELEDEEFGESCQIAERLRYNRLPSVEAVIEHVQNICSHHHHHHASSTSSTPASATKSPSISAVHLEEPLEVKNLKAAVLQKVYSFLSDRLDEAPDSQTFSDIQRALHRLSSVPCIVLDGGSKFVSPKQLVINLYDDDQVPPYVCQAPAELGQFKRLLLSMGATAAATPDQYANALDNISQQAGGEKLHPNEMRLAFTAVRGLFESLKRSKYRMDDYLSRVHWLYFPTTSGHMHRSTEMLFNDDESPTLVERLQRGNISRPLLVDLAECRINTDDHVDLVSLLPSRLRPIYLSKAVREHLEPKCRESVIYHAVADKLKYQITSRTFAQGLIRLIRHERTRRRYHYRTPVRQTVLDSIEHTLKKVKVHGLDHLVTYLTLEGRRVKNSEAELECFAEKTAEDEEDMAALEIWNVYLNRAACLSEELQTALAEVINKIVGGLLKQSIHYIQPILSCLPHNINKVLDKLNVRPDVPQHLQSPDQICQPTLPTPGSLVPKEDHHLLKEDFEEFEIGEYIGFEVEDDESVADGCPTIIYAVVLEKIVHEDFESSRPGSTTPSAAPSTVTLERRRGMGRGKSPQQSSPHRRAASGGISCSSESDHRKYTQEYRINVGDERPPAIAQATDLYKFHRVEGRRRWTREEEGDSTAYRSPTRPQQPSVSVDDNSFVAGDRFSKKNEDENDYKRPTSKATDPGSSAGRFSRRQANKSPRNVFTENNLFAEGPDSPSVDPYNRQPDFESPWDRPSPEVQQATNTTTDVCHYDEEWGPRRAAGHQQHHHHQQQQTKYGRDDTDDTARRSQRSEFEPRNEEDVITTEKVMEEVSDALEEAWQLPENQRRKVVKRLLLRWHPDKNIGNEEFATIITQHVQAELERLELGLPRPASFDPSQFDFDPRNPFSGSSSFQQNFAQAYKFFFDQMNQRAKEHKQQRERYRENFGQDYSGDSHSAYGSNPQPAQAKRFLRQAQEDLRSTDNDYDALDPSYEWVCFKAHQAAEKALKAAQYAVDAVTSFSHDLVTLAASLEDTELRRLAQKLQKIIGNSNRLYNPDPIDFQVIPHEDFTKEMACDAVMCAVDILERVKEFVELRDTS